MNQLRLLSICFVSLAFLSPTLDAAASTDDQRMPGLGADEDGPSTPSRQGGATPPPPYDPSFEAPPPPSLQPQYAQPQSAMMPLFVPGPPPPMGRGFSPYGVYTTGEVYPQFYGGPFVPPAPNGGWHPGLMGLMQPMYPGVMYGPGSYGRPPMPPYPYGPPQLIQRAAPPPAPVSMPPRFNDPRMVRPIPQQAVQPPAFGRGRGRPRPGPIQLPKSPTAATIAEEGYDQDLPGLDTPFDTGVTPTYPMAQSPGLDARRPITQEDAVMQSPAVSSSSPGADGPSPNASSSPDSPEVQHDGAMPFEVDSAFVQSIANGHASPPSPHVVPFQCQSPLNHANRRYAAFVASHGGVHGQGRGHRIHGRGNGHGESRQHQRHLRDKTTDQWFKERTGWTPTHGRGNGDATSPA